MNHAAVTAGEADRRVAATATGILPYQSLVELCRTGEIIGEGIQPAQLQPASLDLRLGPVAYRVRASFLPGPGTTVLDKVGQLDAYPIDIVEGAVLERGCVYIIPLQESLDLRSGLAAVANPKSSTGRLDILTRLITDGCSAFDRVERHYRGPLYVEVAPRTFSVVVRAGTRLNQIRFYRGSPTMAASELRRLYLEGQLVERGEGTNALRSDRLVGLTIDLHGETRGGLIGFRAKKHTDRIDVEKVAHYPAEDYWEPIHYYRDPPLILDPNDFYILVTREAVAVPPEFAAEMIPYEPSVGEFRVHYAGFFDPGFGWNGETSRAVLEVRSHEVPFMLDDRQTVGWLHYERMAATPDKIYGAGIKSSYQSQDLALAKQFRGFRW